MFNIIIFGPPGSGKGTQSSRVAARYHMAHISTGEYFRKEVQKDSKIGEKSKYYIDKGLLVPDEIVLKELYRMVHRFDKTKGFILDGFPRTLYQAKMLDRFLSKKDIPLNMVIYINVKAQELFQRMMGRGTDSGRSDDKESIILKRMKIYKIQTQPLLDYYKYQDKIMCVSGMAPVGEVSQKISSIIDQYLEQNKILLRNQ